MNNFEKAYKKTTEYYGSYIGSSETNQYVKNVQNEIDKTIEKMIEIGKTNKGIHFIKGDIAEPWHSGTHNIDAVVKGVKSRTVVNRSQEFASADVTSNSGVEYGLKFNKNAISSTKSQAESFFERYKQNKKPEQSFEDFLKERGYSESDVLMHDSIYQGQVRIIPKDQLEEAISFLKRKINEESYKRPELVKKYEETLSNISDRIKSSDGSESIPLTEQEALRIAKEIQKDKLNPELHGLTSENFIQWSDIVRESGEAALNAALITAILKATPHIKNLIVDFLQEGEINPDDLRDTGLAALSGAGEGFLRGGIAAIITASCKSGLVGTSLKSVNPMVIAGATVIAINAVHNAIGVYKGKMSEAEFAEACLRDSFVISFGILGASLGQGAIPIPILGAIIGNVIGSICATIVYEGMKNIFFSFFIQSGISFWKIVQQDYTLPEEVLKQSGIDLINLDTINLDFINLDTIELDTIELDTFDIVPLKRGLIKINTIGYIN